MNYCLFLLLPQRLAHRVKNKGRWICCSLTFKLKKSETLKINLTDPTQQDSWEKYLKDNTKQWQDYTQTIKSLEQQINTAVYALFKLTSEEIKLIEHQ